MSENNHNSNFPIIEHQEIMIYCLHQVLSSLQTLNYEIDKEV